MTVLFPSKFIPHAAKSTLKSTVSLTRKTGSTLKSTLQLTLTFLKRRTAEARARQRWVPVFATPTPYMKQPNRVRTFAPVIAGNQVLRLATSAAELDAAQALRYRVFYDEMGARPLPEMLKTRRDFDRYDAVCDHLIVVDQQRAVSTGGTDSQVVGTYRVMQREHARVAGGFYSASEYDVSRLANFPGTVMELGRSCVDAAYRDRATMQLLWRGIAEYVNTNGVDLMFGCASLHGTDPEQMAVQLSYLYHYHLAPEAIRAKALPDRYVNMNILPKDKIDPRRALASLPPLLKGYLRVGGFVGDGAVVDHQFNTTDVCIVVKTDLIADRYTRHYDLGERRTTSFKQAS